jgi:hypothetical protein
MNFCSVPWVIVLKKIREIGQIDIKLFWKKYCIYTENNTTSAPW